MEWAKRRAAAKNEEMNGKHKVKPEEFPMLCAHHWLRKFNVIILDRQRDERPNEEQHEQTKTNGKTYHLLCFIGRYRIPSGWMFCSFFTSIHARIELLEVIDWCPSPHASIPEIEKNSLEICACVLVRVWSCWFDPEIINYDPRMFVGNLL